MVAYAKMTDVDVGVQPKLLEAQLTCHQHCYIFKSERTHSISRQTRKIEQSGRGLQQLSALPLLGGTESSGAQEMRMEALQRFWNPQAAFLEVSPLLAAMKSLVAKFNSAFLILQVRPLRKGLSPFLSIILLLCKAILSILPSPQLTQTRSREKLPAGLLICPPGHSISASLPRAVAQGLHQDANTLSIEVAPSEATNLKTLLKSINQRASNEGRYPATGSSNHKTSSEQYLNYDLQLLHELVTDRSLKTVLISFVDAESVNGDLLSDFIGLLSCWRSRIPVTLLFGISTSSELFQSKLTNDAIGCIEGECFDIEHVDADNLFAAHHTALTKGTTLKVGDGAVTVTPGVFLGPRLSKFLIDRHQDTIQSPSTFVQSLKVCFNLPHA